MKLAHEFVQNFIVQGSDSALLEVEIFTIVANSPEFSPANRAHQGDAVLHLERDEEAARRRTR